MPQLPAGGGIMAPPIAPCPSLRMSIKARRSRDSTIARRSSGLSNGGLARLTRSCRGIFHGTTVHSALGACSLSCFISGSEVIRCPVRSNLPGGEGENRRGHQRVLDRVEIGPPRLPVIRIAGDLDRFVRLERDEFERAGADRIGAHLFLTCFTRIRRLPS